MRLFATLPFFRQQLDSFMFKHFGSAIDRLKLRRGIKLSEFEKVASSLKARNWNVDDQSWGDLQGEELAALISSPSSKFAKQAAQILLRQDTEKLEVNRRAQSIRVMTDSKEIGSDILFALSPLQEITRESFALLSDVNFTVPAIWERYVPYIPFTLILGLVVSTFTVYGLGILAFFVGLVLFVQSRFYGEQAIFALLEDEIRAMVRSIAQLNNLGNTDVAEKDLVLLKILKEKHVWASNLAREMNKSRALSGIAEADEYANWLFLRNVRRFLRLRPIVQDNFPILLETFAQIGQLELLANIANLLKNREFCWVTWSSEQELSFSALRHPLVQTAVPISLTLQGKGALVTGENASGKSTLLRTVGVNLLCAKAFGFCFANEATIQFARVLTSIHIHDRPRDGTSFYMAELARARDLWNATKTKSPCYFLIDEIFKGTNQRDSVASAAGYLSGLSSCGIVIATTHNAELVPILSKKFEAYICERASNLQEFSISRGALRLPNGLALFQKAGFSTEMIDTATIVASSLNLAKLGLPAI